MFETPLAEVRRTCQLTHLDFPDWMEPLTDDSEYLMKLRRSEKQMKEIVDLLFHYQSQEAFVLTPGQVFINWQKYFNKDILDVNHA